MPKTWSIKRQVNYAGKQNGDDTASQSRGYISASFLRLNLTVSKVIPKTGSPAYST